MSVGSMDEFATWLGWLSYAVACLPIVWLAIALLIGIPWIISDELRIRRTAPKPTEVIAYADKMEAEHGTEATMAVGQAMYDALERKDFASRRLLKAVSAELALRMIEREGPQQIRHSWKNSTNP
jgi:hypothetical protein